MELVQELGVSEVRKIRGYHDEPITKGPHLGQRSIRLNRAWGAAEFVSIEEVNKHVYDR